MAAERISITARADDIAAFDDAIQRLGAGETVVVSVEGSLGSGRSTMLDELAERLERRGVAVRRAKAYAADQTRPGAVAQELGLESDPVTGPLALLVDDAQWMDTTSLGQLHLGAAEHREGCLIAVAPERGANPLGLDKLADTAGRRGSFFSISLDPLTVRDIEKALGGTEADAEALAEILEERSQGLADDLDRIVNEWLAAGILDRTDDGLVLVGEPPEARSTLVEAVAALPRPQRRAVEAASLAHRPLSLAMMADLLGGDVDDALEAGEALSEHGLLRETPQGFAAVTDVDAERIADGLGDVRRAATYGSLAKAAVADGLDRTEPALVGQYYQRATMWREALPLLADAGLDLAAKQRFGEALPLVEDALTAFEHGASDDRELEGRLRFARAQAFRFGGWPERAGADLEIAVTRLDGVLRIAALGYGGQVADDRQRPQESEEYLARALYEAVAHDQPAMQGSLLTLLARTLERLGFAVESDAVMAKGEALLAMHGDQAQRYRGRYNKAWIAFDRGQAKLADSLFTSCTDEAAELGGSDYVADVEAWLSRALFVTGDVTRALEVRDSAILHADRAGSTGPVFLAHMSLAEGAAIYGRYEEALEAADEMLGLVLRQLPGWENAARYLRAQALFGLDRLDDASEEIARAMAISPDGIDGKRWRDKIRVLQMQIDTARGEPWPVEEANRLEDDLLGNNWYAAAVSLMTARAVHEKDPASGAEAAALAMQLGAPIAAAEAVHVGRGWNAEGAGAVIAAVKVVEQNIPEEWLAGFRQIPWVAPALEAPDVAEEDFRDAAAALDQQLQNALEEAGLADIESLLSPAQRQARGLRRRRRRRSPWLIAAAAAFVLLFGITGGVLAATLLGDDPVIPSTVPPPTGPEFTALPLENLPSVQELVRNQPYLASAAGGPTRPDLGFSGEVAGYWWKAESQFPVRSSPITWGPYVIYGSTDNLMHAVDLRTGQEMWTQSTLGAVTAPATVAEPRVSFTDAPMAFFGSTDGNVYARDALRTNAQLAWQFPTEGQVVSEPAVAAGVVYVGATDGYLYALRTAEGNMSPERRQVWKFGPIGEISGGPLLAAGYLWIGSQDGFLRAINPTSGVEHCRVNTAGGISTTPVYFDGHIYVSSQNNNIWKIEPSDCLPVLNYTSAAPVFASPVLLADVTYIVPDPVELAGGALQIPACGVAGRPSTTENGTEKTGDLLFLMEKQSVLALDAEDGSCIWTAATRGDIQAAPAVARGTLYVASRDGTLYAMKATTGELLWTYETSSPIETSPALARGMVLFASTDGTVYAIGDGSMPPPIDEFVETPEFVPAPADADPPDEAPPPESPPSTTTTVPPDGTDDDGSNGGGGPNVF